MKRRRFNDYVDSDEEDPEEEDFFLEGDVKNFVIRWPNRDFVLASASSRRELLSILDEIGDPGSTTISEYRGPIYLEFKRVNQLYSHLGNELKQRVEKKSYPEFLSSFEKKQFTDVKVLLNGAETGIECHRIVLHQFPWFDKNMKESILNVKYKINKELLHKIITYLYTGTFETGQDMIEHLEVATFFKLDHLIDLLSCKISEASERKSMVQEYATSIGSDFRIRRVDLGTKQEQEQNIKWHIDLANKAQTLCADRLLKHLLCRIVIAKLDVKLLSGLKPGLLRTIKNWKDLDDYEFDPVELNKCLRGGSNIEHFKLNSDTTNCENGSDMWRNIMKLAFPLSSVLTLGEERCNALTFKQAVRDEDKELNDNKEAEEERMRQSNDPVDLLASHMRVSRNVMGDLFG
ncbi:hypothetical protein AKO1_002536 [Acrasis kona]|uniref:BTB domain-containing protein n=1 Tax=Acrasis kona TaxID=1008807 RepID=A0AAW2ZNH9_9EUKA